MNPKSISIFRLPFSFFLFPFFHLFAFDFRLSTFDFPSVCLHLQLFPKTRRPSIFFHLQIQDLRTASTYDVAATNSNFKWPRLSPLLLGIEYLSRLGCKDKPVAGTPRFPYLSHCTGFGETNSSFAYFFNWRNFKGACFHASASTSLHLEKDITSHAK
ncbi:hypothetical protein ACMFMG_000208 [Clarireedia jacksonii]